LGRPSLPDDLRGLRHLALSLLGRRAVAAGLRGALLALFAFRVSLVALVGLGILGLELLERRLLGLGPRAGLLLAALLLGVRLRLHSAGAPVAGERHPERLQQRERLLVGLGGGGDGHVQAPYLVDRVVVDLGEDDLLADPQRVVAAAVERARS